MRLGGWELEALIGQGGRGEVWRARRVDGLYDGQAAIKLLFGDTGSAGLAPRFAREAVALGRLQHDGIARLLDAGISGRRAYLVLELVEGDDLAEHARAHCPSVASRVALMLHIAEAVHHAHGQMILHGDLKPGNVMVNRSGQPKLLDFGLATLLDPVTATPSPTQSAQPECLDRGLTPAYAAPERISGLPAGTTADVFSLGALLFELLSGSLPFGRRTDQRAAMERAVLHDEPHRFTALAAAPAEAQGPGRPQDAQLARGDLEAIVRKALSKQPEQRYAGVHALIDDLLRWQAHRPVSARRDHWRRSTALFVQRHAWMVSAAALASVVLTASLGVSLWQWRQAEQARLRSEAASEFMTTLLSHGNPERHGGEFPSVLQLLDESREVLASQTDADPVTRARLLEVMSRTYLALNRFDHALPLGEQWLALARQLHGEQEPAVLQARLSLGQVQQIMGNHEAAIALLEPIGSSLAQQFGPDSEAIRQQQFILAADYMHTGRLADAERALERVRVLTDQLHPGDAYERADYLNNLGVLRQRQGRLQDALSAVRQTRPLWASTDPRLTLQVLVLRRAEITLMADNAEFTGIEALAEPLGADMRRTLGPGNDLELQLLSSLAVARQLQGRHADELQARATLLKTAQADGLAENALVPHRAEWLLAAARTGRIPPGAALRAQAQPLLDTVAPWPAAGARARTLLAVAEAALAAGDTAIAEAAMALLNQQPLPAALAAPGSRWVKVAGRLARAQGDLQRSALLLAQRLARAQSPRDLGEVQTWAAHLDLAYTAALQRDAATPSLLAQALAARPEHLPAGHPLDAVAEAIELQWTAGAQADPETGAVKAAWRRVAQARGAGAEPASAGSLGGLLP
jgi:serine/threonine-protein kinase